MKKIIIYTLLLVVSGMGAFAQSYNNNHFRDKIISKEMIDDAIHIYEKNSTFSQKFKRKSIVIRWQKDHSYIEKSIFKTRFGQLTSVLIHCKSPEHDLYLSQKSNVRFELDSCSTKTDCLTSAQSLLQDFLKNAH